MADLTFGISVPQQFIEALRSIIREEIKEHIKTLSNPIQKEEEFLTQDEASKLLKTSASSLWRLRKKKKINSYRSGRNLLFKKSELQDYVTSNAIK